MDEIKLSDLWHLSPDADCWGSFVSNDNLNLENKIEGVVLYPKSKLPEGKTGEDIQSDIEDVLEDQLSEMKLELESFEVEYVGEVLDESEDEMLAFRYVLITYNLFGLQSCYEATEIGSDEED